MVSDASPPSQDRVRGASLGLPAYGSGSLAGPQTRTSVAHPGAGERLATWRAVVRTALLCLLVPALLVDADGRGVHDRLTGTAVVHER